MCGQVGIIFGRKRRRPDERDYLREVFIRMLRHSKERGPHASGIAWLKTDGRHRIPGPRSAGRSDPGQGGIADPLADARRQQEIGTPRFVRSPNRQSPNRRLGSDPW
jgi:hypothetical protein